MGHELIFFGAGASRPFGIPTMQEMVKEFEESLEKSTKEYKLYSEIKSTQLKWYKNRNVDIESIFSVVYGLSENIKLEDIGHVQLFLMNKFFNLNNFKNDERITAKSLQNQLENFIKKKCEAQLQNDEFLKIYEKSYSALLETLPTEKMQVQNRTFGRNWKVFTTNYDLMFEYYIRNYFIIHDFFKREGTSQNYVFSTDVNVSEYPYIKLHGSVDWLKRTDGQVMKKNAGPSIHPTEGEMMIFPIQQKDMYLYPWDIQFQEFKQALYNAAECIVVGYAFNDEFILNMFKEALTRKPKKLVMIDPYAQKIKKEKFEEKYHEHIITLPIKFGSEYFKPQIEDLRRSQKSIEIKIETDNEWIDIHIEESWNVDNISTKEIVKRIGPAIIRISKQNYNEGKISLEMSLTIFGLASEDLKLSVVTKNGKSICCQLYYKDRILPSNKTMENKINEKTGYYNNEIILKNEDFFIKD